MVKGRKALAVAAGLAALAILALVYAHVRLVPDPEDLRAFYCGGRTMLQGHDPYLAEPLRSCENREIRLAGMTPYAQLVLPAPLPAFALVPFMALSLLPFAVASNLYVLTLVLSTATTALLITRIASAPIVAAIAALLLSDGLVTILNGQILPFALLAVCACAYFLERERYVAAGLCAAASAIEPHVALPVLVALACFAPKTRIALAASLGVLAASALAAAGWTTNLEYVLRVLPAHAMSESTAGGQYSLTSVLYHLGVARHAAIQIGEWQYAVLVAAGVAVAGPLAKRYGGPALLALVPASFALFGGPFIHLTQIAVAVPALFVLIARVPERRDLFGVALVILAIPWQDLVENPPLSALLAAGAIALVIARFVWAGRPLAIASIVAAVVVLCGFELALRAADPPVTTDPTAAIAAVAGPGELAESTWQAFVEHTEGGSERRYFAVRLPTWAALAMLIAGTALASRRRDPAAPPGDWDRPAASNPSRTS